MVVSFNRALQAVLIGSALSAAVAHSGSAHAVNRPSVGMMQYPAVSAKQIAFIYSGKLWLVPRNGGVASPLASPPGRIVFPHFSPDGSQIAFSGNYDGNLDLYTLPVNGGVPFRVTHHPASEILCDWCADGKLLFSANYGSGIARTMQLYTVPSSGGLPQKLPVPYGRDAQISPDGKTLAYTPDSVNDRTWKRYRGGWAQDIWLFDLGNKAAKKITDWEGTDTIPMWQGKTIYYLSDGGPEHRLNIWKYDTETGKRTQVTKYADFDVKWPSKGPGEDGKGEIVFEHGSELVLLNLATAKAHAVEVRIPGDRTPIRERMVDVSAFITDWSISPNGKRVAVGARGDIWSVPAKNGSPRNLTHSSGSAERYPSWSPDGKSIAYFSDSSGEYQLTIVPADGKGQPKQLTHEGKIFRLNPIWSPDSKYIAFSDKSGRISLTTVDTGKTVPVDQDPHGNVLSVNWSPGSRWITYAKSNAQSSVTSSIYIYNIQTGKTRAVTAGMYADANPVFDRKGDYLYFSSHRSFEMPQYDDLSPTWVYNATEVLIAMPLRADVKSPYLPQSDEEPGAAAAAPAATVAVRGVPERSASILADDVSGDWKGSAGPANFVIHLKLNPDNSVTGSLESSQGNGSVSGSYSPSAHELKITVAVGGGTTVAITGVISGNTLSGKATVEGLTLDLMATRVSGGAASTTPAAGASSAVPAAAATPQTTTKVAIDFDDMEARSILLPVRPGRFGTLAVNNRNQLIFVRMSAPGTEADQGIRVFDISDDTKAEKSVAAGASSFDISADGKQLLVVRGQSASIQDAGPGGTGEAVSTAGMQSLIDPRAEWRQLFDDAWRLERDYFYDPNMHHLDWQAVHDRYAKLLDECADREDVGYIIGEMISELNVGHAYYGGGDVPAGPAVSVGMLGADFTLENGAYRIAHIAKVAPWDVDARGPLAQPGLGIKEGDYLLAVNGVPLDTKQDPWAAFVGLGGRVVTLTVSKKPRIDSTAADVPVTLARSEAKTRYRAWIERNRAYVAEKTGGKVGYIYVPDTGVDGQNDLVRQFLSQTGKEALIIDERWNGGGQIPDRFIELLNRPVLNYWAVRDGKDWTWPQVSHQGSKCMLINGEAGSGGDAFPWYFRELKLGKLIGTRTWGGLVGLSGNPELIDGAEVTAPSFGFYKKNGTWGIEGNGVDPDIEVLDNPAQMVDGGDPQLDAGIKEMLGELKKHPYSPPKRPEYPDKRGMGINPKDK
jgi:tricorn protease